MNLFVTGTDTDVGKTVITAGIATLMQSLGYKSGVLKPFQSGAIEQNGFTQSPDLAFVKQIDPYIATHASYMLKAPTAPCIAAEVEGINIDMDVVIKDFNNLRKKCDTVIVEGSGGIMVPVNPKFIMSDVAKMLNLPVLIVARPDLGTINHTLLTINHAVDKGLKVTGVIINRYPENTNDLAIKTAPRLIEEYSDVSVVGIVKDFGSASLIKPAALIDSMLNSIDLEKIFGIKIPKLNIGL